MRLSPQRSGTVLVAAGGLGFAAQVVLLRELLSAFAGNELSAGVVVAVWVLAEALGAWVAAYWADRYSVRLLSVAGLASAFTSVIAVPAAVVVRSLFGMLPGEAAGVPALVGITIAVVLLPAAAHGSFFVTAAASAGTPGRAYLFEGIGTAAAGLLVSFILLDRLPSTAVVAWLAVPVAVVALPRRALSAATVVLLLAVGVLAGRAERAAWAMAWPGQSIEAVVNTPYGKVVRMERDGQATVLYDGSPVMTTPAVEQERMEELVHLSLLSHAAPKRVVLLGQALGGYVAEALKHPVAEVTVVQPDRGLVEQLQAAGGRTVETELADPRVRRLAIDPVTLVSQAQDTFDVIIILDATPATLAANRLFSLEFFRHCRERLAMDGILAVAAPGSGTTLSREARQTMHVRQRTLGAAFNHVELLAADFPLLLASGRAFQATADTLAARLSRRHITTSVLDSSYLDALLAPFRHELLARELANGGSTMLNTRDRPVELLLAMASAGRRFSPGLGRWYSGLAGLSIRYIWLGLVVLLACGILGARRRGPGFSNGFAVFTSGLAGAGIYTCVVVGYQMRFGSIFSGISLLTAAFMVGTVAGGALGVRLADRSGTRLLVAADMGLVAVAGVVPLLAAGGPAGSFALVLALAGACLGLQFAAAGSVPGSGGTGRKTGLLTVLDLAGGFLGGLLVALFLIPVFGAAVAALALAGVKLASFVARFSTRPEVV